MIVVCEGYRPKCKDCDHAVLHSHLSHCNEKICTDNKGNERRMKCIPKKLVICEGYNPDYSPCLDCGHGESHIYDDSLCDGVCDNGNGKGERPINCILEEFIKKDEFSI